MLWLCLYLPFPPLEICARSSSVVASFAVSEGQGQHTACADCQRQPASYGPLSSPWAWRNFFLMNSNQSLEQALPPQAMTLVLKALHFAADKHRSQRRKDADASPYINHPIAVAEVLCSVGDVSDPVTLAAAILHDTIEDTQTTAAELETHFGHDIRGIVEEVTDDKSLPASERKRLQIEHAAHHSPRARLVKLADKICNVRDVMASPPVDWSWQRRHDYILWAQAVAAGLRNSNLALEKYFDDVCARALAQLEAKSP